MFKNKVALLYLLLSFPLVHGCISAGKHQESLQAPPEKEMTLGLVQKEIHIGMSQADVGEALGSPNIVTQDSTGKETWIYDKIASEVTYSKDSGGTGLIINLFGTYSRQAGATRTTQKTLTVIIKFDEKKLVESLSYHASKF